MNALLNFYSSGSKVVDDPSAITVSSTSSSSANATPVDLRVPTDTTRLRFVPKIVDNAKYPENNVEGTFVYEKKKKSDGLFPSDNGGSFFSKKDVNSGSGLKLTLGSSETKALYEGLSKLYMCADGMDGIPYGAAQYVAVDNAARSLLYLLRANPSAAHMIADRDTFDLVKELLKLLAQGTSKEELDAVLSGLEDDSLQSLSASLSVERLKRAAAELESNLSNGSEHYWQVFFEDNAWIISQIMSVPCALYQSQAYVGGKSFGNSCGNLPDFLYENKLTRNLAIVEIKTPQTPLLGVQYRGQSYSVSKELSGAITQVLSYRHSLLEEFAHLRLTSGDPVEAFSPQCVVVIGNSLELLGERNKLGSFENFRSCLSGVSVFTYDELLIKLRDLIALLGPSDENDAGEVAPTDIDIPF